ncbi:cytochrome c [uncultured Paraglaciecola sp.]|uniref:c-type cytochrome n=1 Tax=uncultured Paraglaciecola sp. TaxID=1765024 RepID=UPI0030DAF697|tara:strand:+ start:14727 stop:15197 length:471 start_codon:yes stop_codon:yes gene_type:complete
MMKKAIAIMIGSAMLSTFSVLAEPAKSAKQAKDVTEFRQAIFTLVKSNVGALGAMNKGAIPFDATTMQTNALRIEQLSLMLEDYFATNTTGFDVETAALDKVWENQADFKDKISALTAAASNLNKVAKAGDTSQYKPAIGQVFKSCKGCHDNYKED